MFSDRFLLTALLVLLAILFQVEWFVYAAIGVLFLVSRPGAFAGVGRSLQIRRKPKFQNRRPPT